MFDELLQKTLTTPIPLSAEQQATLVDLAAMVVDELELRFAAHKIAQVDAALLEITQIRRAGKSFSSAKFAAIRVMCKLTFPTHPCSNRIYNGDATRSPLL